MTKQELESIRDLQCDLDNKQRELARINNRSIISSPQPSEVHGSGIADTVATRGDRAVQLEREIVELKNQINARLAYIHSIPDRLTHDVVRYACVYGFRWKKIAELVGGCNTEDSVRMLYNRFMEKL